MRKGDEWMKREWQIGCALMSLPAVVLGIWAMICGGVSPVLWGQQAFAWIVLALLVWPLRRAARRISAETWSAVLLLFLAATLLGQEAGGARRWVDLVVFHANAAHLVLPALIVASSLLKQPCPVLLSAALVLCFQPDLSQLAALSAAAMPALWRRGKKQMLACGLFLCVLLIRCMNAPTTLEPAAYCEGILTMLGDRSQLLQAAGWAALAVVPVCFAVRFCRRGETQALSLAVYYAVSLLFAFSGEYPVLLMGFGLSPIAGYFLAYALSDMTARKRV